MTTPAGNRCQCMSYNRARDRLISPTGIRASIPPLPCGEDAAQTAFAISRVTNTRTSAHAEAIVHWTRVTDRHCLASHISRSYISRHDAPYIRTMAEQASSAPLVPAPMIISLLVRPGGIALCDRTHCGRCMPTAMKDPSHFREAYIRISTSSMR
jgi:hypothetical protein